MEMARGTKMITKAMVSSLIPKTAPKKLNISIMVAIMILSIPKVRTSPYFSSEEECRIKERIPASMALLSFMIQKAPPKIKIKTMMLGERTKPL